MLCTKAVVARIYDLRRRRSFFGYLGFVHDHCDSRGFGIVFDAHEIHSARRLIGYLAISERQPAKPCTKHLSQRDVSQELAEVRAHDVEWPGSTHRRGGSDEESLEISVIDNLNAVYHHARQRSTQLSAEAYILRGKAVK
jgi:hypothetical protein